MSRIEALYRPIVNALAILAGAIVLATALSIPVDVTLRACCTSAVFGLTDIIEHGLAAATFLAAPWVLAKNAHVSVDIMVAALPTGARRRLDMAVNFIGAGASAIFFWYCTIMLATALERGSMVRGIVVVPEWLTFVAPVICTLLLSAGFLLRAAKPAGKSAAPGL